MNRANNTSDPEECIKIMHPRELFQILLFTIEKELTNESEKFPYGKKEIFIPHFSLQDRKVWTKPQFINQKIFHTLEIRLLIN